MAFHFNPKNQFADEKTVLQCIAAFQTEGELFGNGNRNQIKLFDVNGQKINIKSFKKPNFINAIVYRFFRKSKAQRSFEYANLLIDKGFGTPQPIAYLENRSFWRLRDSYYVSEHLEAELTFRELTTIPDYPDHENILRQFTQFTFNLHQSGVEFLDHSPGNTLIKTIGNGRYAFYLVDLNRMKFHRQMNFETRINNMSRLTTKQDMVAVMANEYAKISGDDETLVADTLWRLTCEFQYRFYRKKRIKKKLLFWK